MPRHKPLFDPSLPFPLRLSRRTAELFLECPRCFYNEVRRGIKRPSIPSFTLNKAVDTLLKREFDKYRKRKKPHPLFAACYVNGVPYAGSEIDIWRSVMKGIQVFLSEENVEISGAPDDVLQMPNGSLSVVDFKATAKKAELSGIALAGMYADSYTRQLSWYTFLIQQQGYPISDIGYLLIVNARVVGRRGFGSSLSFIPHVVPVRIDMEWILPRIREAYVVASSSTPPKMEHACAYCSFIIKQ